MGNYYQMLADKFRTVFFILLTLYIMGIGYAVLMNMLGEKTKSAMISVVMLIVCYWLVFDASAFLSWVYEPLFSTSSQLTSFILKPTGDGTISDAYSQVDQAFTTIFKTSDTITNNATGIWERVKVWLVIGALALLFGILYAVFTGLLILGMFALHVMMVLGGIIILLAAFPFTRSVFWAWLRACFNYALIPVFTAVVMAITLQALNDAAKSMAEVNLLVEGVFTRPVGTVFLIGVISLWFHLKAPEFAALLTGSTSTGGGFFGTVANVLSAGMNAKRGAAELGKDAYGVGKGAWGAGKGAYRLYSRMKGIKVD